MMICLYIFVQVFMPSNSMKYFGMKSFVVMSSSMEPEIKVNDVVIIKKITEDELKVHDIITFMVYIPELGEKGYVTHYIGKIETLDNGSTIYYTQGASKGPGDYDQWTNENGEPINITYQNISGKVVFKLPYIGHIIPILKDPVMVFLLGLNVLVIYSIIKLVRPKGDKIKSL